MQLPTMTYGLIGKADSEYLNLVHNDRSSRSKLRCRCKSDRLAHNHIHFISGNSLSCTAWSTTVKAWPVLLLRLVWNESL